MNGPLNYPGAAIFWLYILAALFLSSLVIYTIISIKPAESEQNRRNTNDQTLFSLLALSSFTVLSINMLRVLIQSFGSWSQMRPPGSSTNVFTTIWTWSVTSTLFLDFAESSVEIDARFRWAASALLMTFGISLFLGVEGSRRHVPRLWAFFGLGQILPISFTQNLFYVALLRSPATSTRTVTSVPIGGIIALAAIYCGTVSVLPFAAGSAWLMCLVLVTRVILLLPLGISHLSCSSTSMSAASPRQEEALQFERISPWSCSAALALAVLLVPTTATSLGSALFSHPAVCALGSDFILSLASSILWEIRQQPYQADQNHI